MSRAITFSTTFPSHHPKKGEKTFFREKIWAGLAELFYPDFQIPNEITDWDWYEYYNAIPKYHTIRKGNRWKVGDKFSPRVWSGKPYQSKQIIIAPDIEIKKIWNVEVFMEGDHIHIGHRLDHNTIELFPFSQVAKNDGLSFEDMRDWFNVKHDKPSIGQILCWNENIEY